MPAIASSCLWHRFSGSWTVRLSFTWQETITSEHDALHLLPFMSSPLGVHTRQPTRFGTRQPLLLTKINLELRPCRYRARNAQLAVRARKLVRRLVTQDVLCALARLPPEQCELAFAFED